MQLLQHNLKQTLLEALKAESLPILTATQPGADPEMRQNDALERLRKEVREIRAAVDDRFRDNATEREFQRKRLDTALKSIERIYSVASRQKSEPKISEEDAKMIDRALGEISSTADAVGAVENANGFVCRKDSTGKRIIEFSVTKQPNDSSFVYDFTSTGATSNYCSSPHVIDPPSTFRSQNFSGSTELIGPNKATVRLVFQSNVQGTLHFTMNGNTYSVTPAGELVPIRDQGRHLTLSTSGQEIFTEVRTLERSVLGKGEEPQQQQQQKKAPERTEPLQQNSGKPEPAPDQRLDQRLDALEKKMEALQRENERLKKENEELKAQLALARGGQKVGPAPAAELQFAENTSKFLAILAEWKGRFTKVNDELEKNGMAYCMKSKLKTGEAIDILVRPDAATGELRVSLRCGMTYLKGWHEQSGDWEKGDIDKTDVWYDPKDARKEAPGFNSRYYRFHYDEKGRIVGIRCGAGDKGYVRLIYDGETLVRTQVMAEGNECSARVLWLQQRLEHIDLKELGDLVGAWNSRAANGGLKDSLIK